MIEINNEKDTFDIIWRPEDYKFSKTKEILWKRIPWKFEAKWETKDGNYYKYSFTVKSACNPEIIRKSAIVCWLSTTTDGSEVTDDKAKIYDEQKKFKKWEIVWIRIPKNNAKSPINKITSNVMNKVENYKNIKLRKDWALTFYKVEPGDTINSIRNKISKLKWYEYLCRSEYDITSERNIRWFNIPSNQLKAGIEIPLPIDSNKRVIPKSHFKVLAKMAINLMEKDKTYWESVKKIKKSVWIDKMAKIMVWFAQQESKLWEFELHRWEESKQDFSYWYFHILFNKGYPGEKAAKNMNITKWTSCTPLKSCKLFIWYCCERAKEIKKDPEFFFNINNETDAKTVWKKYNGSNSYWSDLWDCLKNI